MELEDDDGDIVVSEIPDTEIDRLAAWLVTVIDLDDLASVENENRYDETQIELEWN